MSTEPHLEATFSLASTRPFPTTAMQKQGRSATEVAATTAATLNTLMATSSNNAEDKKAAKVRGVCGARIFRIVCRFV